jgi:putative transposase
MTISFAHHLFAPAIIRQAVWLYVRFTLSYRDTGDLLAERALDVSYEMVRRWVSKFAPVFARELRRRRPRPTSRWHLDEIAVMIGGRHVWLLRKLLKKQGFAPSIVSRRIRSISALAGASPPTHLVDRL